MSDLLSEVQVRKEVLRSLHEWGIPQNSSRKEHVDFRDLAIHTAISYSKRSSKINTSLEIRLEQLQENTFPNEPVEAIRHVLRHELVTTREDKIFYFAEDRVGMNFNPFYERTERYNINVKSYKRKTEFQKFSLKELDPLVRFTRKELNPAQWYHKIWQSKNSLAGNVFEALVSCHLVFSEACFHCKCRNTMRWNGGSNVLSSWADVVCIQCKSTYEIKSKASIDAMEKTFEYHNFSGGSFKRFYENRPLGKRYLVVVNRAPNLVKNKPNSLTHIVWIAEIDKVLPRLSEKSFVVKPNENVEIKSEIILKKSTLKKGWCHVKHCREDHLTVAIQVYNNYFGTNAWQELTNPSTAQLESNEDSQVVISAPHATPLLDDLRHTLEDLKVGNDEDSDDDWENLYSI